MSAGLSAILIFAVMKTVLAGVLFSVLWASASVATKFGVLSAEPLMLANLRFFIAALILLLYARFGPGRMSWRLPQGAEWRQLAVFGFFNTSLYLALYVFAMKYTAAGIGTLAVATNPLLITLMASFTTGRWPSWLSWISLFAGMAGIFVASLPLLDGATTTATGLVVLGVSMLSVSWASVYYTRVNWRLNSLQINGWQVALGAVFLLPVTLVFSDISATRFDERFWASVLWLSIAVSAAGLICWFYLLRIDPFRASLWLFLCPVFGFIFAWWLMDEPVTWHTGAGTAMVILALVIGQRTRRKRSGETLDPADR
jgi:drug/metabolite transporter (DMT)-like permease